MYLCFTYMLPIYTYMYTYNIPIDYESITNCLAVFSIIIS